MDNALFDQRQEPIDDLPEDLNGLGLGGVRGDPEVLFEVGVAEFLDDVVIVCGFHDVVDSDNVLGLDLLEDLYLLEEGVLEVLVGVDWVRQAVLSFFVRTFIAHTRFVPSCYPRKTSPYDPFPNTSFRWIMYPLIFLNAIQQI